MWAGLIQIPELPVLCPVVPALRRNLPPSFPQLVLQEPQSPGLGPIMKEVGCSRARVRLGCFARAEQGFGVMVEFLWVLTDSEGFAVQPAGFFLVSAHMQFIFSVNARWQCCTADINISSCSALGLDTTSWSAMRSAAAPRPASTPSAAPTAWSTRPPALLAAAASTCTLTAPSW